MTALEYEVETSIVRASPRREPITVGVRLVEVDIDAESTRTLQSWALPVDHKHVPERAEKFDDFGLAQVVTKCAICSVDIDEGLEAVERLASLLGELYHPAGVLMFVSAPHRLLDGDTVASAIRLRAVEALNRVSDSLDALADGTFL